MLSFKEKIAYGIGRLGSSITIDMADLFLGYVYYAYFGLSEDPFLAFLGVAIGKIVIAFSSYFSGYLSDRTNTRLGRRKPFIILGAPSLAFAFFMLYSPHLFLSSSSSSILIFGYLLLFNALYQFLYGFLLTPFQSWLPEITTEGERLEVSGYQNTVNLIAFIIGAGTAFLIPAIIGSADDVTLESFSEPNSIITFLSNGQFLTFITVLFAVLVITFFIPSLLIIKAKEVFIPQISLREELAVVTSNKNYINWTIARGILSIMISGLVGILLAWIDEVLQFNTFDYLLFGLTLLASIFIGFIFWIRFGNNQGKTKSFIYSMSFMACILPFMLLIGQIPSVNAIIPVLLQGLVFAIAGSIGLSGYYILPYAIVADIIEEDENKTNESRAGAYYGFESIPLNFFQFIGYLMVGFLLQFLPQITDFRGLQYSLGYLVFGPLSTVIIIISVVYFRKFVNADPLRNKN